VHPRLVALLPSRLPVDASPEAEDEAGDWLAAVMAEIDGEALKAAHWSVTVSAAEPTEAKAKPSAVGVLDFVRRPDRRGVGRGLSASSVLTTASTTACKCFTSASWPRLSSVHLAVQGDAVDRVVDRNAAEPDAEALLAARWRRWTHRRRAWAMAAGRFAMFR
jgi:hypothetical protein